MFRTFLNSEKSEILYQKYLTELICLTPECKMVIRFRAHGQPALFDPSICFKTVNVAPFPIYHVPLSPIRNCLISNYPIPYSPYIAPCLIPIPYSPVPLCPIPHFLLSNGPINCTVSHESYPISHAPFPTAPRPCPHCLISQC